MSEGWWLLLLPFALVGCFDLPFVRIGVNTADEGYLLKGTMDTVAGKVPIRDFRAYDPGRYYFCALWVRAFGPKFRAIRYAMSAVSIGFLLACCAILYQAAGMVYATAAGCALCYVWLRPHYKHFEMLFSIASVLVLSNVPSAPPGTAALGLGAYIGIAFFFGLNIGLYALGATVLSAAIMPDVASHLSGASTMLQFGLGLLLGSLPFLWMFARHRGLLGDYLQRKVLTVLRRGTSNLPLPQPWVWNRHVPQLNWFAPARQFSFKLAYTFVPFYCLAVVLLFTLGLEANNQEAWRMAAQASLVGLIYFHHIFSRADVDHLCVAIHPVLIALSLSAMAWFDEFSATTAILLLVIASAWLVLPASSSGWNYLRARASYISYETGRESLLLWAEQAEAFVKLKEIVETHTKPNEPIFAGPDVPGYFPLFQRDTAVYDVYCVQPATARAQSEMLEQLKRNSPVLALVASSVVDGRQDLRFDTNYDEVWSYLAKNYHSAAGTSKIPGVIVLVRRDQEMR